jgi:hypothetical protein
MCPHCVAFGVDFLACCGFDFCTVRIEYADCGWHILWMRRIKLPKGLLRHEDPHWLDRSCLLARKLKLNLTVQATRSRPLRARHTRPPGFTRPITSAYRLALAGVERLATGCRFNEGAVYFGDARCLLWSDIPNNCIMRWDEETGRISIFRQPSNHANGNTRDRQGRSIYVFDVADGGAKLANGRMFINCEKDETPDGFRVDVDGNLWCGWGMSPALDGVKVFNPAGKAIGFIALPERAANVCFGGRYRNRLFMAASHSRSIRST